MSITWTPALALALALALAGHLTLDISHPEYRSVVAALIEANYVFTQFGAADVLGELPENGWGVNECPETYARMITAATLERCSIGQLVAQLMLDSYQPAPDARSYAAFNVYFSQAMRNADRHDVLLSDYESALRFAKATTEWNANRMLLRGLLMESTSLTSPVELTRDVRRLAYDRPPGLFSRIIDGGLELQRNEGELSKQKRGNRKRE